jgi:P27 family predicted phage terminase small subunit
MPTHLKVLRGNPGHQALRAEPEPTVPPAVPAAPSFLMPYAQDEWARIAEELYRLGCLTVVDVHALAAYCQAFGHWRTAEEALAKMRERDPITAAIMLKTRNGNAMPNPLLVAANKAASDMIRYASEFGLTPAARSRIAATHVEVGKPKFAGLLAG